MTSAPKFTHTMPVYPTRAAPEIIQAAIDQLTHGEWARLEGAPETERALEAYHGGGLAWFIASGTAALEAILLGHGIGPGDEVITTPYTWGATVSAILAIGAIPVFADIDGTSGLLDPETVATRISKRTRAIMAVHLFGSVCDMPALSTLARQNGLLLFEDGSQAHGARLNGEPVGRLGDAAAFSCMGLKLLAGTEGGYALFADPVAAENAKLYGQHPRGLAAAQAERLGAEGLLDTLQMGWRPCSVSAALVRAKLPHLDAEIAARQMNGQRLRENLANQSALILPEPIAGSAPAWHLLSIVLPDATAAQRDLFIEKVTTTGLTCFRYIPVPIHRMKRLNPHDYAGPRVFWHEQIRRAGIDYRQCHCPQAEWRAQHSVEMAFNWTEPAADAMDQMAECLIWAAQQANLLSRTAQ